MPRELYLPVSQPGIPTGHCHHAFGAGCTHQVDGHGSPHVSLPEHWVPPDTLSDGSSEWGSVAFLSEQI